VEVSLETAIIADQIIATVEEQIGDELRRNLRTYGCPQTGAVSSGEQELV